MAYGKDNNRGIHAGSPSGDPSKMPDGYFASVGSLTGNKGKLGQNPGNPTSRQDIPGSQEITPAEQYNFQSPGESGFLGQDQDDYHATSDPERPSLPNPEFAGASGTTNMGQQGAPVDWNSVAPFEYPDFAKGPSPTQSDPTASTGK